MGRPRLELDESVIEGMAGVACTVEDIARVLGCSKDTLERNYMDAIEVGRANMRCSLRKKQWTVAMNDDHPKQAALLVWLGKQLLNQTDKPPVDPATLPAPIQVTNEQLERMLQLARGSK